MKIAIVVLVIASAAVCAPPGRGYPPCSNGMPPPPPPYLRNVTQDARDEYFEILSRDNETIAQQNQDILTWARKYGLEAEVQEFRTNSTNRRTIVEQNVTSLIGQLGTVLQQGIAIVNDENQTAMNQTMALRNLSSEYPQAFAVLQFAVSLFLPPGAPQLFGDIQPGVLPSPGVPPPGSGPCGFPPLVAGKFFPPPPGHVAIPVHTRSQEHGRTRFTSPPEEG
ncbi:hypothetical protein COOONC_13426 [Cooperia oncophora]